MRSISADYSQNPQQKVSCFICSGRAVQASSSYEWVPPTPSLQSDAACQRLAGAARCGIKDSACPVSVPCAEKCWSTPPSPSSLHAEKCVTFPLEGHVLKSVTLP